MVGGMVDIWKSIHKVFGHKVIGPRIAAAIDAFFADHLHAMETLLSAVGDTHVDHDAMDDMLAPLHSGAAVPPVLASCANAQTPATGHEHELNLK